MSKQTDNFPQSSDAKSYRARFRFRVLKRLKIDAHEIRFQIEGQEAVLSAATDSETIDNSDWLVINARGFATEQLARDFGARLKWAIEVSSVATRQGIDGGIDRATSSVGESVRQLHFEKTGQLLRNNVHGLDVFEDDPRTRMIQFNATGSVRKDPEPFLGDLSNFMRMTGDVSQQTSDIVALLNVALMVQDPVAQIVFAFSAVEMLGQQYDWSAEQKTILNALAESAEGFEAGTEEERREIADAIRKGTHRVSLRQGVMRLLKFLELDHLRGRWDELYGQRSSLVHALAPAKGADYGQLAADAISLCGFILLKAIAKEVPLADRHAEQFYPATESLPVFRYFSVSDEQAIPETEPSTKKLP